ncbi:type I-B CRISPR-associated endonuclease Cas1b [Fusibacter ferrireducens]|uniref:CRISPR-associated endonuclease Cas1 n=1 Tax=Fusibacter ferrireducens TaxID=2785058 RepID=A0ABR9ZUH2_9FIRM|nr:type I-B CRISPR-associated endonuclease Cas1b [Fusibacter ferrireducens]MBF4693996.1 type I-B CRISPR-associated endonuclease Cas1 [Fusibacter ferrireducens]
MGETFYILNDCNLKRKDNNIALDMTSGVKKYIKSEVTDEIYLFGETTLNTKALNYISQQKIILHVFNYYGFYSGTFYPRESNVSGYLLVEQVRKYDNSEMRVEIAREIIRTAAHNIFRNLRYYNGRGLDLEDSINNIQKLILRVDDCNSIQEIMGIEGNIRKQYYSTWDKIIKIDIDFTKRVKRPPDNMINSLLSFVNSLVYTTVLSEIYKTQLNPTISFLHEPGAKRFSLCLDVAEIFKPLIGERMIFSLLNKKQITSDDFESSSNGLYLKDFGRKIILKEYDSRLERTIMHRDLGREVSYRYLIRLECYKLIKDIIGEKKYQGFKIWW